MTALTRAQFEIEAAANLPDNTFYEITPFDVRQTMLDLADSATFPEDGGTTQTATAAGAIAVGAGVSTLILNLMAPNATTTVNLPAVSSRNGLKLKIVDFKGNAGDIVLTANGTDTVMGLATGTITSFAQGLGSGAAITLTPVTSLNGWIS